MFEVPATVLHLCPDAVAAPVVAAAGPESVVVGAAVAGAVVLVYAVVTADAADLWVDYNAHFISHLLCANLRV